MLCIVLCIVTARKEYENDAEEFQSETSVYTMARSRRSGLCESDGSCLFVTRR